MEHTVYVFEGFQLDVTRRQLSSSGGVVLPLSSRAMDALLLLVANAGQLLEKRRLMETVWPAAIVEDNNLNQCILAIRKALGEAAGSNRYIMTVPGRGYCFVCPVSKLSSESSGEAAPPAARTGSPMVWIAVTAVVCSLAFFMLWMSVRGREMALGDSALEPAAADLVLRLRHVEAGTSLTSTTSSAALARCLVQRPDMHLQIEVRMVGGDAAHPLWTGHYVAGADDFIASGAEATGSCADLMAPPPAVNSPRADPSPP